MSKYLIYIAIALAIGFLCAWLARRRGANPKTWFVVGTLLSVVALAVTAFLQERSQKDRAVTGKDDRPRVPREDI